MSQMSEALDRMADHRSAAMTVNRSGWTREQYLADAERLMNDLDGSVSSLVNGHAMALIDAVQELRERVAELEDGITRTLLDADSWTPYDSRDTGETFLVDTVRDLLAELRALLDPEVTP